MRIIDPGHAYILETYDQTASKEILKVYETLTFVKREGDMYPGNIGRYPGTNAQEVLRCLIDRIVYLNQQIPSIINQYVLSNLRWSIYWLEFRAAERHNRVLQFPVENIYRIEQVPTCPTCGHIECSGHRKEDEPDARPEYTIVLQVREALEKGGELAQALLREFTRNSER